jgi:hypothetical protein
MAHTHEFDCRICGAHLDSQQELEQHNQTNHPDRARDSQASDSSGMRGRSSSDDRESSGS